MGSSCYIMHLLHNVCFLAKVFCPLLTQSFWHGLWGEISDLNLVSTIFSNDMKFILQMLIFLYLFSCFNAFFYMDTFQTDTRLLICMFRVTSHSVSVFLILLSLLFIILQSFHKNLFSCILYLSSASLTFKNNSDIY